MAKHTPGPYIVDEMSDAFTIREKRTWRELALIIRRGTTERRWQEENANAELFAAAPDLLKACKMLCNAIKFFGQRQCDFAYDGPSLEFIEENWQDSILPYLLDVYKGGEAAITKAKGGDEA